MPVRFRWIFLSIEYRVISYTFVCCRNNSEYTGARSRTYFIWKENKKKKIITVFSRPIDRSFSISVSRQHAFNRWWSDHRRRRGMALVAVYRPPPGDYMCYKHVSFWSITLMTTEACVDSSFWAGTPVGTSSSIGQRVVVLETVAEGGGGGGGGGEITTSGSPARSQSNLQRIFSGWSPPNVAQQLIIYFLIRVIIDISTYLSPSVRYHLYNRVSKLGRVKYFPIKINWISQLTFIEIN